LSYYIFINKITYSRFIQDNKFQSVIIFIVDLLNAIKKATVDFNIFNGIKKYFIYGGGVLCQFYLHRKK
jgi:hypothetical protein